MTRKTKSIRFETAAQAGLFGKSDVLTTIACFSDPLDRLKSLEIDVSLGRFDAEQTLEVAKSIIVEMDDQRDELEEQKDIIEELEESVKDLNNSNDELKKEILRLKKILK